MKLERSKLHIISLAICVGLIISAPVVQAEILFNASSSVGGASKGYDDSVVTIVSADNVSGPDATEYGAIRPDRMSNDGSWTSTAGGGFDFGEAGQLNFVSMTNSFTDGYQEFTIAADTGYQFNLTSVDFGVARGGTSKTRGYAFYAAVDGGGFDPADYLSRVDNVALTALRSAPLATSIDLTGAAYQGISEVTFRWYSFNDGNNSGYTLGYDAMTLNGSASLIPEPSTNTSFTGGLLDLAANWDNGLPNNDSIGIIAVDGVYSGGQTSLYSDAFIYQTAGTLSCVTDSPWQGVIFTMDGGVLTCGNDLFWHSGSYTLNVGSTTHASNGWAVTDGGIVTVNGGTHTCTGSGSQMIHSLTDGTMNLLGGTLEAGDSIQIGPAGSATIGGTVAIETSNAPNVQVGGSMDFDSDWTGSWTVSAYGAGDWKTLLTTSSGITLDGVLIDAADFDVYFIVTGNTELRLNPNPVSPESLVTQVTVFLQGGQSNADGRADPSGQSSHEDVDFFYRIEGGPTAGTLGTLFPGASETSGFGPELSFGRTMTDLLGGATATSRVCVLKYANGGTRLWSQWYAGGDSTPTGDGSQYVIFQQAVASGLAALAAEYTNAVIEIEGMIWHQGESDIDGTHEYEYATNLTDFIVDVRATYGTNLPFMVGQLSSHQTALDSTGLAVLRAAQGSVAEADSHAELVNTDSFSLKSDDLHYDAIGQLAMGRAFAYQMAFALGLIDVDVIGHWSFDSDYTDVSGNGLDGSMVDVSTIGDSGITTTTNEYMFGGGALNLTADKDYIALPATQSMATDTDGYAFSFWAKDRLATSNLGGMVVGDPSNTTDFFWVDTIFGGARWRSNDSAHTKDFATGAEDTEWHHWVVVVKGPDVTLYQDGIFHSIGVDEAGSDFNFAAIGDAYNTSNPAQDYDYNGQIDEVWLFGAAIDADTVSLLYTHNQLFVEPPYLSFSGPVAGNMQLSWNAYGGVTYTVQTNSSLTDSTGWNALMSTNGIDTITVTVPITEDQSFLRVIEE